MFMACQRYEREIERAFEDVMLKSYTKEEANIITGIPDGVR
jgi:hypothetical protein